MDSLMCASWYVLSMPYGMSLQGQWHILAAPMAYPFSASGLSLQRLMIALRRTVKEK
ncbi:MAG: hypothetical protein MR463_08975 [Bacteroidales bacterium]|nr:hypothetical protein [Bacteroidales bacterium]